MLWMSICGLWKAEEGKKFVASGRLGFIRFFIFKNDKKGNAKAPDYRLSVGLECNYTEKEKQEIENTNEPPSVGDDGMPF